MQEIGQSDANNISGVAQWKRVGLITQRSVDRNHSPLLVDRVFEFDRVTDDPLSVSDKELTI